MKDVIFVHQSWCASDLDAAHLLLHGSFVL